jgi:hypothetical protein
METKVALLTMSPTPTTAQFKILQRSRLSSPFLARLEDTSISTLMMIMSSQECCSERFLARLTELILLKIYAAVSEGLEEKFRKR